MSISSAASNPWRRSILQQLLARNKLEQDPFQSVIVTCNSLFEKIDSLQREKLLLENSASPSTTPTSASNEKIVQLQNEIKEYQKSSAESATTIEELSTQLQSAIKERNDYKLKFVDASEHLDAYKQKCNSLQSTIHELESQVNVVTDEHTALQIAYSSLKKKFDALQADHADLIARWMAIKAKDAESLNEENEKMIKIQNEKLKKQLEDAVKEMTVSPDAIKEMNAMSEESIVNPLFVECIVPKRALTFVEAHPSDVYALKWNPQVDYLTTGGGDRKVKLWNLDELQFNLRNVLIGSNAAVTSIDIFEDFLVASSNDHASRVWSLSDFRVRRTLTGHSNKVMAVKFLGVNNKVVSGSIDKTVKVWDLNRNVCVLSLFPGSSCHDLVNISSKDSTVASGHYDKRIRFWDIRKDYNSTDIVLQGKVTSLDISADGRQLLCSVREEHVVKCLDLRMNNFVMTFTADTFNIGCDWTKAKFSPDGRYVACGGADSNVFVWETLTGRLLTTQQSKHHSGPVVAVEWHPKGTMFASADRNKNVVLWK